MIGGGDFACLVADKSTSSIENQDELRMSTTHQKKHGFFSPFSSSILHMQQQHQYNARAWNEQKRESMGSSSSSFIIILHMQQQQNAKSVK
jgi:hypothetical protein